MNLRVESRRARVALALFAMSAFGLQVAIARAAEEILPIDLPTTLRLAGAESIEVQLTQARLEEAQGLREQARARFFPWIEPSVGYRRHEGRLQDVVGQIIDTEKQAYEIGATIVADVDLGQAIYASLAARRRVRSAEEMNEAQKRQSIADATAAYLELARARGAVEVASESVRIAEDYAGQLARAVEIGIAFKGDQHRAEGRVERNRQLLSATRAERRVAAARLAERLTLDPGVDLSPVDAELAPWDFVDADTPVASLIETALAQRPELRGAGARLEAAEAERDAATLGPMIPTIGARARFFGLGGGVGDGQGRFGDGQDYSVGLSWRLGPGGLFDTGRSGTASARERQASLEQQRAIDQVTREVVEAHAQANAFTEQWAMSKRALDASEQALKLSRDRKEFGVGSVLETLQAEEDLTRARLDYLGLVAAANRAQVELRRATGGVWSSAGLPETEPKGTE